MERAVGGWCSAGQEGFLKRVLTRRIGKKQAFRVDAGEVDSRRDGERRLLGIGRVELCGFHHELGPDRQRRPSAFQIKIAIVVVTDPRNGEEVFRVSREPAIT